MSCKTAQGFHMILFHFDGNSQVGSGHIMRCLSLAGGLRKIGQETVFVTADDLFQAVIQKRGYKCIVLHTRYDHMEEELPVLRPLLRKFRPRCVIVDSYFVTPDYMAKIRKAVWTVAW